MKIWLKWVPPQTVRSCYVFLIGRIAVWFLWVVILFPRWLWPEAHVLSLCLFSLISSNDIDFLWPCLYLFIVSFYEDTASICFTIFYIRCNATNITIIINKADMPSVDEQPLLLSLLLSMLPLQLVCLPQSDRNIREFSNIYIICLNWQMFCHFIY